MEEILASIKRVIAEDGRTAAAQPATTGGRGRRLRGAPVAPHEGTLTSDVQAAALLCFAALPLLSALAEASSPAVF